MIQASDEVPMRRTMNVRLDYWVAAPALVEIQVAVASGHDTCEEDLAVSHEARSLVRAMDVNTFTEAFTDLAAAIG